MKVKLVIFFCILSTLSLTGYEWLIKTGELTGQVFVVTKGADNIKLGLVDVSVIPETIMLDYIEKKKAFIDSEKNRITNELDIRYVESVELGNNTAHEIREAFLKLDSNENLDRKMF